MLSYKVKTIRALERGLEVLQLLQATNAASLHDLHRATGLAKATLMRVLLTLERRGLVWQRMADGAYLPRHTPQARSRHVDDEHRLSEVASPVLERLVRRVDWPSILAVPRLDYMEVIETNRPRSYFHHIALGPIGFRINILRSATGRAYLAFCGEAEREAVLARLRASHRAGGAPPRSATAVARMLNETRRQGYAVRQPDFGGHFDKPRSEWDDGRNSIALPIAVGGPVIGCVNLTWIAKVAPVQEIVRRHLASLREAVEEISHRMQQA
ncbi:MAG: transcriptional regulator [Betaproteobacteria bacterium RIFCSPLOWO2_02_FULL_66_14]|nr:MAG: transcriptional regulator [Betaproteobacteria bacterium RIFCSPLOWO2_02_FULL_66_14]